MLIVILLSVVVVQGFTIEIVKETFPEAAKFYEEPPVYLLLAVTVGELATVTVWVPTSASLFDWTVIRPGRLLS